MDPKIDTFCQIDISDLAILGVKKVDFWTFSKLFWSCLGSVRALFSTLEGPLLGVFSALKVDKWPRKLRFCVKKMLILTDLRGHFRPIYGSKKSLSGLFPIFFKFLGKLLSLYATHTSCSPLGPREALKNVDKASSALLVVWVWVWCGCGVVWLGVGWGRIYLFVFFFVKQRGFFFLFF